MENSTNFMNVPLNVSGDESSDDINILNVREMSNIGDNNNNHIPYEGMIFDTEQDAYNFYNEYGKIVGFSIRINAGKKHSDGKWEYRLYVCSKEGKRKPDKRDERIKTPRAETRTGCGAYLKIKLEKNSGKYIAYEFAPTHNHEVIKFELSHMLPSQRKISNPQREQLELAESSGIVLRKSYELMTREVGGRECLGFTKVDHKNYLRTKRQKDLAYGEIGVILKYFQDQASENESFFHAFQLDNQEKITNIFWADAQMIMDYGHFGDVVSFDTTYKVHKDSRPFAIFIGFNHHREGVIFGAALMHDETADSFSWLFDTFLQAMSNKHPKTIFTDQDAAMAKALVKTMPNTFHRLCKWHIMQNALKHVNHIFKGDGQVHSVVGRFFDEPDEEGEWIIEWDDMLDKFGVRENLWLKRIFGLRHKWARPYVRWNWSAGMRSTQLSESVNADLKLYLRSDYGFSQFFTHFDAMVEDKRDKERDSDYSLSYKLPKYKVEVRWLQHASLIYTKKIFDEFQQEYVMSLQVDIIEKDAENGHQLFVLASHVDSSKNHRVTRNEKDILSCTCILFDMRGILCCHIIKVLNDEMRVHEIPDIYILKRWTRAARSEKVSDMNGRIVETDPRKKRTFRHKTLLSLFRKIASRGCETEEIFTVALKQSGDLLNTIERMLLKHESNYQLSHDQVGLNELFSQGTNIQAKGVAKRDVKGPPGRKRIKSMLEKNMTKKRKKNVKAIQDCTPSQQQSIPPLVQNTQLPPSDSHYVHDFDLNLDHFA